MCGCPGALPFNGLPRHARRLFLTCAVHLLLRSRCQAIRGTSEWRRVELAFADCSHQRFSRPQPQRNCTPIVSFMIGGVWTPLMKVSKHVKQTRLTQMGVKAFAPGKTPRCILVCVSLGACRTLGVESENAPQRGQFLSDSPPHSGAMGQEAGKKWAAAAHSQPTIPKSDRLLGAWPQKAQRTCSLDLRAATPAAAANSCGTKSDPPGAG